MIMNQTEIQKYLPHRDPILLIDSVSELSLGHSITTITNVNRNWEIFRGHFPQTPILPGIYITECMAQSAALLLLTLPENSQKLPLLFQIQQMRFIRPVYPDDVVMTSATLSSAPGNNMFDFTVTATVQEKKAAIGTITLFLK